MAEFSTEQALVTAAIAIASALFGAYLSRINERKKLEFSAKDRARSLRIALAAEIEANLKLVFNDEFEKVLFILSRRKDNNILRHQLVINRDVYDNYIKNLGDIEAELASQIIYYYARMKMFVEKFDYMKKSFEHKIISGSDIIDNPYLNVEETIKLKNSIKENGISLMRNLNDNKAIGEYNVTYRIDPADQEREMTKAWANEKAFLDKKNVLKRWLWKIRRSR